jgi:hypothetical protein
MSGKSKRSTMAVMGAEVAVHFRDNQDYISSTDMVRYSHTANQWRDAHPDAENNVRDHATLEQLVVLTISKASTPCSSVRTFPPETVSSDSTKLPSRRCGLCWQILPSSA